MFVRTIASDAPWGAAVELPWEDDWDEGTLRHLVEELDGVDRTALVLTGSEESQLAIGGSALAGLVVYASYDGDAFSLVGASTEEGTREVVAGGTLAAYPMRYIVAPEQAVRAAWRFARDGQLEESLSWEGPTASG